MNVLFVFNNSCIAPINLIGCRLSTVNSIKSTVTVLSVTNISDRCDSCKDNKNDTNFIFLYAETFQIDYLLEAGKYAAARKIVMNVLVGFFIVRYEKKLI